MQHVNEGDGLTVLGVDVGYGAALYDRMWEEKFARAVNDLRMGSTFGSASQGGR